MKGDKYIVIEDYPNPIYPKQMKAVKGEILFQCSPKEDELYIMGGTVINDRFPKRIPIQYVIRYEDHIAIQEKKKTIEDILARTEALVNKKQIDILVNNKKYEKESKKIFKPVAQPKKIKKNVEKIKKVEMLYVYKSIININTDTLINKVLWKSDAGYDEFFNHAIPISLIYKNPPEPIDKEENEANFFTKVENDLEEIRNSEELNPSQFEYVHPSEESVDAIEIIPSKKWPKRIAKLDENRAKQIRIFILMNPNLSEQKIATRFLVSQNTIRLLKHGDIYRDAFPTKEDFLALQSSKENNPSWLISEELYKEIMYGDFDTSGDGYYDYFLESGIISMSMAHWQVGYHRFKFDIDRPDCPHCRLINKNDSETGLYLCSGCEKEFGMFTGTHINGLNINVAQIWRFAWLVSNKMDHFKIISKDLNISEELSKNLISILEKEGKVDTWEYWKDIDGILDILMGPINMMNAKWNMDITVSPDEDWGSVIKNIENRMP